MTDLAGSQAQRFENNVNRIARDLRRLADRIEQEAARRRNGASLARIAGNIIHELNWGFANLNADNLVAVAEDHREITEAMAADHD